MLQNLVYEESLMYHPEPSKSISVRKENVKDPLRKYKMHH